MPVADTLKDFNTIEYGRFWSNNEENQYKDADVKNLSEMSAINSSNKIR